MAFEAPFLAALNHLLEKESWARERLSAFAGAVVELAAAPLPPLRLRIDAAGLAASAAADAPAALVVSLRPGAIDWNGDQRLAETVRFVARHLRWDVEEDLSRITGDVLARRLVQAGRDFSAWQRDAAQRTGESLADYFAQEKRLLVGRLELEGLAREREDLERRIAALEQRARALE
jgi:ubiquinone biosynthesis accessory factor UbiJ